MIPILLVVSVFLGMAHEADRRDATVAAAADTFEPFQTADMLELFQAADTLELFQTADACMACHNGLTTPAGEDVSIGTSWRASMMANSARDPYWHAAVRRETIDHPTAKKAIESECSTCHMPMAHFEAVEHHAEVFAHLSAEAPDPHDKLAMDGVSCTVCHQISDEKLGERESFVGGFVIAPSQAISGRTDNAVDEKIASRRVFGPFDVDQGRAKIMRSASDFQPTRGEHLQKSEVCATCHTLYTHAFGEKGEVIGELPEQVPYLEWKHSAYRDEKSCQSCHMPVVTDSTSITSVLGQPRAEVSRHVFRGGNFFMPRILNRYRDELDVSALPQELDASVSRTLENLQNRAARISLDVARVEDCRLEATVTVENLAGHKLPTAYPSRRAWIRFRVIGRSGAVVFESGALRETGDIVGNDNDEDPSRFEPHYVEIAREDQVQIYEPILVGPDGAVTTGLLTAVSYIKDNRILPRGFEKATAHADVAVYGAASRDGDFVGGSDRLSYAVTVPEDAGPYRVEVELWYQPIGYRWAHNLAPYDAPEPQRFVRYYTSMASVSAARLAVASAAVE